MDSRHSIPLMIGSLVATLSLGSPTATGAPTVGFAEYSPALQSVLDRAIARTIADFSVKSLKTNQLAVTVVDLKSATRSVCASYRGDEQIYPASVVKLFYLAAAHQWLENGQLMDTPELRRAMQDMIVESYNEATHYIVDLLTDTTSGPELSEAEIDRWFDKRNAVNRYFTSLGYTNINCNKKPWCEGPYGRESQSIRKQQPNRNMLTTDATARLLAAIATGRAVTPGRSAEMLNLMKRDPYRKIEEGSEPDQGNAFTGLALRDHPGAKLWSKAGWTSQTRHDAAYIELPNGARFVLVTFTTDHANERGIIESIARRMVEHFSN